MGLRFFAVPALDPGELEEDLNRFLRAHRVVNLKRELVMVEGRPVWCVSAEFVEGAAASGHLSDHGLRRNRVDYKEVLAADDFARFSKLREVRKKISEEEGVPVYAILTNEQLAAVAQKQPKTLADLQAVDGIGEGKGRRYGERLLAVLGEGDKPPAGGA